MPRTITLSLLSLGVAAAALFAEATPPQLDMFLRRQLGFTPLEMGDLEKGQIVVKLPPTPESREVAAFAIMRLHVPSDYYVNRFQDIVNFKKSENVLQIGKFSSPPRPED